MNPEQANALLLLIADLARIIYSPPPTPPPPAAEPSANGAQAKQTAPAA